MGDIQDSHKIGTLFGLVPPWGIIPCNTDGTYQESKEAYSDK